MSCIREGFSNRTLNLLELTQIPTITEIDETLAYLRELLADPRLTPRRRILVLDSIDDLLDDRLDQTSHPSL